MQHDTVIAIPTLNEAATIAEVITHFMADAPGVPILVIDGGSTDGTCEIVRGFPAPVRLIANPAQRQAAAINIAADWAAAHGARILIRADAHARYPSGFTRGLIEALAREHADSVVVPLIATGQVGWQRANALLQQSWLGHGGAAHRKPGPTRAVSHGHHAAFRVPAFRALGGYDTTFAAAEDVDFDHRLIAMKGRIIMAGPWAVHYLPRTTPRTVFQQFLRNGKGRARFWQKHRLLPAPRQALPILVGIGWPISLLLGLAFPFLALPGLAYLMILLALSACITRARPVMTLQVMLLALLTHTGFAMGVIGTFRHPHGRRRKRITPT